MRRATVRNEKKRPAAAPAVMFSVLLTVAAFGAPAAEAAPPTPDFGRAIDGYASYDPQDTCTPSAKAGTQEFANLLLNTYPQSRSLGIARSCNVGGTSEHKEGRAFDWGVRKWVSSEKAAAEDVINWLLKTDKYGNKHANARRLGIMYMIWDSKIWGSYRANDGWRTYTGSNPHTDHIHFSMSWDGALKRTTWWSAPSDVTPPSTSLSFSGSTGSNGWYRGSVTTQLSASDSGSGVSSTKYRIDNGAWRTYSGSFLVSGQGSHTVKYYSVDKKGNQESTRTATVKIDSVDPVTTSSLSGTAGSNGWWRSGVTVSLSRSDATSGISKTSVQRDGASFTYGGAFGVSGQGGHTVKYRSLDKAGNWESWRTISVPIDSVAPATSLSRSGPSYTIGNTWYVGSGTTFSTHATDATSGPATTQWQWRGATNTYNGAFGLPGADGPGTLKVRSSDRAGNWESWRSQAVHLDRTPPTMTSDAPPDGSLVVSLAPTPITVDAHDAGVGVARVEFIVDGVTKRVDTAAPYTWTWVTGDEALGEHKLVIRAVDRVGNAATATHHVTTAPTTPTGAVATAEWSAAQGLGVAADAQRDAGAAAAALQATLEDLVTQGPGAPPNVGLVLDANSATTWYRVGVTADGDFIGVEGWLVP